MPRPIPILTLALLVLLPSLMRAETFTGRVTRVIDGDTIVVRVTAPPPTPTNAPPQPHPPACESLRRVRLADIDSPELSQPHGPKAKAALEAMILDQEVIVQYTRRDRYRRILATVHIENQSANHTMVANGHAWRYRYARKTGAIAEAEQSATKNKLGLWASTSPTPPWTYRSTGTGG